MIRQTLAIFIDAYRELNAKKLFWFVLVLSALFVGGIACVGINAKGVSILWWSVDVPMFNSKVISKSLFYRFWFYQIGFKFWLTWAATILALVSTAGLIPEFVGSGAIELSLSKPISRVRLFFTKYLAGLLFVALQVTIFSVLAFVVVRVRGEAWVPELMLAIPLVLLLFSYLYAFCTLIGLITRSTIAALLLTMLVWVLIFLSHTAEKGVLLTFKVRSDQSVAIRETDIQRREADLATLKAQPEPEDEAGAKTREQAIASAQKIIDTRRPKLESAKKTQRNLTLAHSIMYGFKTVMPKTTETIDLLGRYLLSEDERRRMEEPPNNAMDDFEFGDTERELRVSMRSVQREVQRELRARTVGWVLGTSLIFEGVIVGIAAWMFCRRDF